MKIGIRAHDFGCLPPVRLAEKMAAQGVEAAQLAIPKAIAGVESYAQVTDGLLREIGADEAMIKSICSHGYGLCTDIKPEHLMEKTLFAADELTGLIWAAALMRPSKSVSDM